MFIASLLVCFWRLFGLIFWPFRLHSKNFSACGIDTNLFGVFRSGLDDINRPEVLSSCCLQFRATNAAVWHLGQRDPLGGSLSDLAGVFRAIFVAGQT